MSYHAAYGPPLVVAEVVYKQQRGFGAGIRCRKDAASHERVRHDGRVGLLAAYPFLVVSADELAEFVVGFILLERENLLYALVGGVGQLYFPVDQLAVYAAPVGEGACVGKRSGDASELGPIVGRGLLLDQLPAVQILLDG